MVACLAAVALLAPTLEPTWTTELFTDSSATESIAYVGFVAETKVAYVSSFGQIGWLDTKTGRRLGETRIGHQILSGWLSHGRIWLQTPSTPLIEVDARNGSYIGSHFIGTHNDIVGREGSDYLVATRYDKPIDVFRLPEMKLELSIPHGRSWRFATSHKSNRAAIIEFHNLSIWDLNKRVVIKSMRLPLGDVMDVRFTPDDKQLAISYDVWNGTILYDAESLERIAGVKGSLFVPVFAHRLNFVANMGYAVGYYHRPPRLWVPGTDRVWELAPEAPRALAFSPSDRHLVVGRRNTVSLYRVPSVVPRRRS